MRDVDIIAVTIIIGTILIFILLISPIVIETVKQVVNAIQSRQFGTPITYIILGMILVVGSLITRRIVIFLNNIINEVIFFLKEERKGRSIFVIFVSISTPEIFKPSRDVNLLLNKVKSDIGIIALPAPEKELFGKPKDKILYKRIIHQFGNIRMIIFPIQPALSSGEVARQEGRMNE
jgi:hypothetical protein